jgi:hypothetical protein
MCHESKFATATSHSASHGSFACLGTVPSGPVSAKPSTHHNCWTAWEPLLQINAVRLSSAPIASARPRLKRRAPNARGTNHL